MSTSARAQIFPRDMSAGSMVLSISIAGFTLEVRSPLDFLSVMEVFAFDVYRRAYIRSGDRVLDLGAGIGEFTVLASKLVGVKGVVVAVEPSPEDFAILTRNVRTNGCKNVRLVQAGAGQVDGEARRVVFRERSFDFVSRSIESIMKECGIPRIDFVKMDIEGQERLVVPASLDRLAGARAIAAELHGDQRESTRLLEERGFSFHPVTSKGTWRNLVMFTLRHPVSSVRLYSLVRPVIGHSILFSMKEDLAIARDPNLVVGVFERRFRD